MKAQFYYLFIFTTLLCIPKLSMAQLERGARKPMINKDSAKESNSDLYPTQIEKPGRPDTRNQYNRPVPEYDQIHSPIRWYAIENENNSAYWEGVNTQRIWIVLEEGRSIEEPEIHSFLESFGFTKVISESKRKHQINYWIFDFENSNPQKVLEAAKAARLIGGIKYLEPSVIYTSHYTPNDPLYPQQWGPYVSYFDEAWDESTGGNSYNVVAVIDDACDWNHEDLYGQVWYGWDYAQNDADISPDDPMQHKHGTHTTGTVAATINNGIGVAGMVNDTVYFAKVGNPDGTLNDEGIINAYYDIGDIQRITAVNMSFGGDSPSAASEQGCNYAWNNGKLLLVSSGNNGTGSIAFPAALSSCMAVGSIGADGTQMYLTTYSQFGNEQEICAPGGDVQSGYGIVSTVPLNQYEAMEGTSMAAPHVTGLAGLIKHVNMDLTNADIRNIINSTAIDFGNTGWDTNFGYGMINAGAAIQAAINGSVGISEKNAAAGLKVYPNPAEDYIHITTDSGVETGLVEVFDITGKIMKIKDGKQQKHTTIAISELPKGVYILRIKLNSESHTSRFIKI